MEDSADLAQARILLTALREHISHVSRLLEKAESKRRGGRLPNDAEKALRRDLYEAHRHAERLHARFPQTRGRPT